MKFIRKGGRIIPIREGSGAAASSKRKYPSVKKMGASAGAAQGAVGMLSAVGMHHLVGIAAHGTTREIGVGKLAKLAMAGAAIGAAVGTFGSTKRAKGESKMHVANRISNWNNARKKKK